MKKKVFTTSDGLALVGGGDGGRGLRRQTKLRAIDQQLQFGHRLSVARQPDLHRRQMHIDHLHGGELLMSASRGQAGRQSLQPAVKVIGRQYARNATKMCALMRYSS